jgi:hypothetical protein
MWWKWVLTVPGGDGSRRVPVGYGKLGAQDRVSAVATALRLGLSS